jgi:hypothetical protein
VGSEGEGACASYPHHGNVDMQIAILNSLITPPVRPQHPQFIHLAAGAELTEGTVHAPFDGVERAAFEQSDVACLRGERQRRRPDQVLEPRIYARITGKRWLRFEVSARCSSSTPASSLTFAGGAGNDASHSSARQRQFVLLHWFLHLSR